jgi:DNA-binding NarL/FixJ family response regulator
MHVNIAIAEDNSFALRSILEKLKGYQDLRIRFSAFNGVDLIEKLASAVVDIVLMDIEMPVMNGIEATFRIRQQNPRIRVIALTTFDDDEKVFEMVKAGASGYLLKDENSTDIYKAITEIMKGGASMSPSIALKVMNLLRNPQPSGREDGGFDLTKREIEVLEQLKNGLTYDSIADNLFISYGTVRKHIENIYRKLEVDNKVSAINIAVRNKIV